MSKFNKFMKGNKIQKENKEYAATKSLVDEEGKPLLWTIKPLTTKDNNDIRDDCTFEVSVKGKPNVYRPKVNTSKYTTKMICASVVEPNLNDKELQDSYNVMNAEELLLQMIDDPAEFNAFATFVQELSGFVSLDEQVEEAKN